MLQSMFQLKIPPPVYTLLIGLSMWLLDRYFPVFRLIESPWNLLGVPLFFVALFMDFSSLLLFFNKHTTINPMKPQNATELVTNGTYRYTRNPMYLGLLIILSGFAIWLGSLTPFFLLPLFFWLITTQQILPEERFLQEKFGNEYLEYKNRVRRWL